MSATGDVSFKNHTDASRGAIQNSRTARISISRSRTARRSTTPFTYDGAATIRKTGAGTLKLADVPTSLSMQGGPVTFAANTRPAMTSLEIGEGQSFTITRENMGIHELVAIDGSLTLAAAGLTVNAYTADAVAGAINVTKTALRSVTSFFLRRVRCFARR